jgi:ElaB/YqjD/DUF883 family membrane-anchored ribosome-binding protein
MSEYNSRSDPAKVEPESGTPVTSSGTPPTGSSYDRPTGVSSGGSSQQGMTDQAKEKASEYGDKAQEQAEKAKDQAAGGMEQAAGMIRDRASSMDGTPGEAGTKVAEGMETAATYLKEHNTTEMWNDLEHFAKEHPGQALAGAVVTGFVLGRILR